MDARQLAGGAAPEGAGRAEGFAGIPDNELVNDLRRLIPLAGVALYLTRPNGSTPVYYGAWSTALGWPEAELANIGVEDLIHPDDRRSFQNMLELQLPPLATAVHETRFRHRDGTYRWFRWTSARTPEHNRLYAFGVDITSQKDAEARSRRNHYQLLNTLDAAQLVTFEWDVRTGAFQLLAPSSHPIHRGLAPTPKSHEDALAMVDPRDRPKMEAAVQKCLNGAPAAECEYRVLPEGRWVLARLRMEFDDEGCPVRLRGTSIDVHHLRQAEERLHIVQSAIDQSTSLIVWTNQDGRIEGCNALARKHLPEGLAGARHIGELCPQLDRSLWRTLWSRARRDGTCEFRADVKTTMDRSFPVSGRLLVLAPEDGGVGWLTLRDISDEERASEALRRAEERFRGAFMAAPFPMLVFNDEGEVVDVNRACLELSGYTREDMRTVSSAARCLIPDEVQEALEIGAAVFAGSPIDCGESVIHCRNGETRIWRLWTAPLGRLEDGHLAAVATAADVTDLRRSEASLAESEAILADAQAAAGLATFTIVTPGPEVRWSPEACAIYGLPPGSEIPYLKYVHPDDRQKIRDAVAQKRPGKILYRIVRPSGEIRHIAMTVRASGETETPLRAAGVILDITERLALERQLAQAQKMEAIGRLAAGVAHDFNNLLTVIGGHSHLALRKMNPGDPHWEALTEIEKAAARGASLTHQLLAFSRKQVLQTRVTSLNDVIRDSESMLRRLIGEDVKLVTVLEDGLRPVVVDAGQIVQVVMNLAVNARDAMPHGGSLTITTSAVDLDAGGAARHGGIQPGPHVCLRVTDTGAGIDPETLSQIFEPFFTTKPVGQGTGLGLSTVYGIVQQSGGGITVSSRVGEGTTFEIFLPATNAVAPSPLPHRPMGDRSGAGTVLVVEDDDSVRDLARQVLHRAGYTVFTARNGDEALDAFREHAAGIDLLIADMVLPGATGREIAQNLQQRRPQLGVVYMSGYNGGAEACLQKPFTPETLLARVRSTLCAQRSSRTVLVIGDDSATCDLLCTVTAKAGYHVVTVAPEAVAGQKGDEQCALIVVAGPVPAGVDAATLRAAADPGDTASWLWIGDGADREVFPRLQAVLPHPLSIDAFRDALRGVLG